MAAARVRQRRTRSTRDDGIAKQLKHALLPLVLTLALFLTASVWVEPIDRDGVLRVASPAEGFEYGPTLSLESGSYRARVSLFQIRRPENPGSIAAVVGFSPEGIGWSRETRAVRPLDLELQRARHFDFTIDLQDGQSRHWVWRIPENADGLTAISSEVRRETSFWRALTAGGEATGNAVRFAFSAAFAVLALTLAWVLGRRVSKAHHTGGPVTTTISAVLSFCLGAVALYAAGVAVSATAGAGAEAMGSRWSSFPGWQTPVDGWGANAAAALSLASLFAAVLSMGTNRILPWAIPAAALGLSVASGSSGPRGDFHVYYAAGQALLAGVDPYSLAPEAVLNPPPFVLASTAFALSSISLASFLWFGLKLASLGACIVWARRALTEPSSSDPSTWWRRPEWIGVLVTGRFLFSDMQYANTNLVVLAALLGAAWAWSRAREGSAALALAIGTAVKATPLFAALTAGVAGRLRLAITAVLLTLALFAVSIAAIEAMAPGAGGGFARVISESEGDLSLGRADNQSLRALADRFVGGAEVNTSTISQVPTLAAGRDASRIAQWLLMLPALGIIVWIARVSGRSQDVVSRGTVWSAAALGILLLSPASWSVHYVLWLVPAVALAQRAVRGSRGAALWLAAMAVITYVPAVSRPLGDLFTVYGALPVYSLALLFYLAAGQTPARAVTLEKAA